MLFRSAFTRLRLIQTPEILALLCCVFVFSGIIVSAQFCLGRAKANFEETGLGAARRDTGYVRDEVSAVTRRIDALEQNALQTEHAYRNTLPDFKVMLDGLRRQAAIAAPEVLDVAATDAAGNIEWSTNYNSTPGRSIADRDYFQTISTTDIGKIISTPVIGKLSGKPTIQFVFAVRDTSNKFQGTVVVAVDANVAKLLQNSIHDDHESVVSIVRSDSQILSRSSVGSKPITELKTSNMPGFISKVVREGSSSYHLRSQIDGVSRFYAASHIPEWNAVLLVGLDDRPEMIRLSRARTETIAISVLAGLVDLALYLAAIASLRRMKAVARIEAISRDLSLRENVLIQIAKNTKDMIHLMDEEFRYIYLNEACRQTLGFDIESRIGLRMGHSVPAHSALNSAIASLMANGGSQRLLLDVPDIAGKIHWLDVEIVKVDIREDDIASPCRYFSVAHDVTERVLAERKAVVTQQRIENILRLGPGFFFELYIAADGEVCVDLPVECSDRLLGHSMESAIRGGMLAEQTHPGDHERLQQAIQRCIADGWASTEFRVFAKDGALHWMLCQMQLARSHIKGHEVIAFVTDVTSEHTMRNRLRHSEQLATLGHLSANVAHEMNQPLAAILLSAENALHLVSIDRATPERMTAKLESIVSQVQRLSQFVNRIRQFSRDEHGEVTIFTVDSAIDEALTLAAGRINASGVVIETRFAADLPSLQTERLLLEQILMNLVVNACDAYMETARLPSADTWPVIISADVAENCLIISVADRAGGIPPSVMAKLFEPFFTTKSQDQGTGLGLSICAANVAELGGEISARNADGGAVFEVHLPSSLFARPDDTNSATRLNSILLHAGEQF